MVLDLQQNWKGDLRNYNKTDFLCIPTPTYAQPSPLSTLFTRWYKSTLTHHNYPMSILYTTLSGVHSMSLDKGIITYIHHYNIIRSIFTADKNLMLIVFKMSSKATLIKIVGIVLK